MRHILPFLLEHGYSVLFLAVLAEQAGLPIPATPVLLGVGALVGLEKMSLAPALLLSLIASALSDSIWYWLGRRRGGSILRILCAISLEPESCVSTTRNMFSRLGSSAVVIAKFVPGLSTAAPPMAGMTLMPYWLFVAADGLGALLWAGVFLGLGWIFRFQIEVIGEAVESFGSRAGLVMFLLLAAYIAFKFVQRRRFLRSLRVARITPAEVLQEIEAGVPVTIVDLRNEAEVISSGLMLPHAKWYSRAGLEANHLEIPRDRDIILYCS